jgi:type I restriction enzyme S subunit
MASKWRSEMIGNLVRVASGQIDPKEEQAKSLLVVGPENLYTGGGLNKESLQTAEELGMISGKYAFDSDAILYSKIRPNLNKVCLPDFAGLCSADMYPLWVRDKKSTDRIYVYYLLISERFVYEATSRSFRTGLPKINRTDLESITAEIPPLPEQQNIARILQTWDEAIDKAKALAEKWDAQYEADLKRIFAPCHPTFKLRGNGWVPNRLGKLFKERDEGGTDSDALLSITMANGVINQEDVGRRDSSTEDKSKYKLILPGDIGYNTMRMWQGVCGLSALRGIISPAYTVVTPIESRIHARYAFHLFKSRRMIHDFERYSQGLTSDTWNLKYPALSEIKVFLPSLKIQTAQANYLDALKEEIAVLKRQAEALSRQKRGLMQKLLTGKWRVKARGGAL